MAEEILVISGSIVTVGTQQTCVRLSIRLAHGSKRVVRVVVIGAFPP